MSNYRATVVITTRNRQQDLERAVRSALAQTVEVEVLIIDDGSIDGTSEMIRTDFPSVNFQRRETTKGLIVRRNEGARLAQGDIIFSIDDDAEFSAPDIVESTLRDFDDPRVTAVAIPFINVNRSHAVKQTAPELPGIWITNEYIGTAHAIRRTAFLQAGGYRESLVHQGEEGDLCIRMLARGELVRLTRCRPVYHYESVQRNVERLNYFGQRNLLLFGWYNVPSPECFPHILATTLRGLLWGLRHNVFWSRARGTGAALRALLRNPECRRPVSREVYWLYRRLKKKGPFRIEQIAG